MRKSARVWFPPTHRSAECKEISTSSSLPASMAVTWHFSAQALVATLPLSPSFLT